jgi:hypothetical protein
VLANPDGVVRPDLVPLHRALTGVERPDTALVWMSRPKVAALLSGLGGQDRPLTHELLDEFPADKTLAHLRAILVAVGALPTRDERLAKLERWITTTIDAQAEGMADPAVLIRHLRGLLAAGDAHPVTCRPSTSAAVTAAAS